MRALLSHRLVRGLVLGLLLGLLLGLVVACGEKPASRTTLEPSPPPQGQVLQPPRTLDTSQMAPAPTGLAAVAQSADERLAGLRGEAARGYVSKLIERALPTDEDERRTQVLEALLNGRPSLRWVGLLALPHCGPMDDEMFRALLRQTGTGADYLDAAACAVLQSTVGIEDAAAARMWLVARTAPASLRAALYRSLATYRPQEGRKDVLRQALGDEDAQVRRAAAFALLQLLPEIPPVPHPHTDLVEPLMRATERDLDHAVRVYTVFALARLGPAAAPVAERLAQLLRDPSSRVHKGLTKALSAIGEAALPALRTALQQRDHAVTETVAYIVQQIGSPAARKLLREGLTDPDPYVRGRCAMALSALKAPGVGAVAIYRGLLGDPDGDVVLLALEGLGQTSSDAGPALEDLRQLSQHTDARVRRAAEVLLDLLDGP